MLTSLVFKEWLKIKWIVIGLAIVHGIVALTIYYDLANLFKAYRANEVIIQFLTFEVVFYVNMKYVALLSGLLIGVFQFFPELNQSRLKLTFHLPVKESILIFQMALTGVVLLLALSLLDTIALSIITLKYLPREFFESMLATTLPWYLGGLCLYLWVVVIFVEPNWAKRILLLCVGIGLVSLYIAGQGYATYVSSLWYFAFLMLLSGSILFLSAYNFKRGIW